MNTYFPCIFVCHKYGRMFLASADSMCYSICAVGKWSGLNLSRYSASLYLSMSENIVECFSSRKQGCVFGQKLQCITKQRLECFRWNMCLGTEANMQKRPNINLWQCFPTVTCHIATHCSILLKSLEEPDQLQRHRDLAGRSFNIVSWEVPKWLFANCLRS